MEIIVKLYTQAINVVNIIDFKPYSLVGGVDVVTHDNDSNH